METHVCKIVLPQDSQSTIFEYRYRGIYAVVLMEKISFIRVECSLCKKVLLGREKKRQKKNKGRKKKKKTIFQFIQECFFYLFIVFYLFVFTPTL